MTGSSHVQPNLSPPTHVDIFTDFSDGERRLSLDQRGLRISLVWFSQQSELSSKYHVPGTYESQNQIPPKIAQGTLRTQTFSPQQESEIRKHTAAREDTTVLAMRCRLVAPASPVRRSSPRSPSLEKKFTRQNTLSQIARTVGKPEPLAK